MTFTHVIGKSTLKYGFTIPKRQRHGIDVPAKGERRRITLVYADNQRVAVWLVRARNSTGSVQVRYDGKYGEPFKNWLRETFKQSWTHDAANINEYIEVSIISSHTLVITAFPLAENTASLYFEDMITHNIQEELLLSDEKFVEIIESVRSIAFQQHERQMFYNRQFKQELRKRGWLSEQRVVPDKNVRLTCDFRKADFQLEVEFGNARTYYQDIVKFVMSRNVGLIQTGGLVVPSSSFARHLCHLGRLNAVSKRQGKKSTYAGMMDFNKAAVEFQYVKDIFNIPFFIVAVGRIG